MTVARTRRPRKISCRRGAALVEFAFVLPLIILFFTASIELFRMNQVRHAAESAAYEACRHVIVPGATQAEATAKANHLLGIVGVRNATVSISPTNITESTATVTVNVTVPAKGNTLVMPFFARKSLVSANSSLLTERVPAIQAAGIPQP